MLKVLDLFSGIGGFSLGLERTSGFETIAFCEIDPFCQKVLAKHWPGVPVFSDIKELDSDTKETIPHPDIITAGFPCQPFSQAGRRKGADDERYLWPEIERLTRILRPRYVILENVPGLLSINDGREFGIVVGQLSEIGYRVEWQVIPASSIGAAHLRNRVFIVAYPAGQRCAKAKVFNRKYLESVTEKARGGWSGRYTNGSSGKLFKVPNTGALRVVDGLSEGVDESRIKALGNAVVPQVVQFIGECIIDFEYF
jgi:DNA (cytosine-5)-methyltransferase 1